MLSIINFYLSRVDNILDLASDLSGLAWDSWKRNSIDGSYAASTEINMPRISPNMHVPRFRIVSALNFSILRFQFRNIGIFKAGKFFISAFPVLWIYTFLNYQSFECFNFRVFTMFLNFKFSFRKSSICANEFFLLLFTTKFIFFIAIYTYTLEYFFVFKDCMYSPASSIFPLLRIFSFVLSAIASSATL